MAKETAETANGKLVKKQKEQNYNNYLGAIILITIGIIFLFNTTGILPWGVWGIFLQFWPLFLIIAGFQIIFGGSKIGSVLITLFSACIIFTLFILTTISYLDRWPQRVKNNFEWLADLSSRERVKEELKIPGNDFEDIDEVELEINHNAGKLSLSDESIEDYLTVSAEYTKGRGAPSLDAEKNDQTLTIDFDNQFNEFWTLGLNSKSSEYKINVNDQYPIKSLDLTMNAGEGDIDLEEILVDEGSIKVNAGDLEYRTNSTSVPTNLEIEINAGSLDLYLPESIALDVSYDINAGSLSIDDEDFNKLRDEGSFRSENFKDAQDTIKIKVKINAGSLNIIRE
jgi:hypothetical protein